MASEVPPRPGSAGGGGGGGGGGRGVRPQSARQSVQRPQSAGGPADAGLGQPRNEEGALRELLLQRIVEARL